MNNCQARVYDGKMVDQSFFVEHWPVACANCNASYGEDEYESLDYLGIQKSTMQGIPDLELRSCNCDNTLAIVVINDFA